MRYAVQKRHHPVGGMSLGRMLGIAAGVFVLGFIAMNVPDVIRYLRMTSM